MGNAFIKIKSAFLNFFLLDTVIGLINVFLDFFNIYLIHYDLNYSISQTIFKMLIETQEGLFVLLPAFVIFYSILYFSSLRNALIFMIIYSLSMMIPNLYKSSTQFFYQVFFLIAICIILYFTFKKIYFNLKENFGEKL